MAASSSAGNTLAPVPVAPSVHATIRSSTALAALALLLVVALAIKNVSLGSPIMAGDEYAYFVRAREFPFPDAALAYDPTVQATNNVLYFAIGKWLWAHTADPALSMRILQSGEYGLLLLTLYALGRFTMTPLHSVVVALISGVTAMSSYSAYFMPETLYQLLFACLCFVATWLLPRRIVLGVAASSGVLALMLLTKPHAIAVVLAVVTVLLALVLWPGVFRVPRQRSVVPLLMLLPLTWLTLILADLALEGRLQLNPLFVIGTFYGKTLAGPGTSVLPPPLHNFVAPVVGNALALALLVGVPLVFIAHRVVSARASCSSAFIPPLESTQAARVAVLATLAVTSLAFALVMTVIFTALIGESAPGELWRLYGRYYSFSLPVIVVSMASAGALARSTNWGIAANTLLRVAALLSFGAALIALVWWRAAWTLAPWDFPEVWALTPAGWLVDASVVGTLLLAVSAVCFLLIAIAPRLAVPVFLAFFAAFNLTSLVQTTRWQFAHGRGFAPYSQPAAALRILLGPDLIDRGVVVGANRGIIAYTLFALRSRSPVVLLPTGSVVTSGIAKPNAAWVLMQGDYKDNLPGRVIFNSAKLTLVALDGPQGKPLVSFIESPHP